MEWETTVLHNIQGERERERKKRKEKFPRRRERYKKEYWSTDDDQREIGDIVLTSVIL